jgi:uncharacterized protein YciI
MAQFLVLAYDGTDAEAPARALIRARRLCETAAGSAAAWRRRAVRPAHFDSIKPMVENREIRAAGAMLDDDGAMIGSVLFMEFPSRAELDAWLAREPYVQQGVW